MDPRLGRSPSPALSIGRDGKPLAHVKHHSRPSSRSSSRASSRPSSRGSPYSQNPMLLSALHQGPSPQPPGFAGLALPSVPLQRISPLPLPGFHHPSMPIFQGSGLVNLLPSGMPPGSFSPELLARASSASSISPGSQSSMSPISALRPSPIHPQLAADLIRLQQDPMALQMANHRQDLANFAAQQHKLDIPYSRGDLIGQEHLQQNQTSRQGQLSMPPPPPNREVRQDITQRELLCHEHLRDREQPPIKREPNLNKQPLNTYPATGALAQLIKMNSNQIGTRVTAPSYVEQPRTVAHSHLVNFRDHNIPHQGLRTAGGKPVPQSSQSHAHVGAHTSVPVSFVVPNSAYKQTVSYPSSSVISNVHNPSSVPKQPYSSSSSIDNRLHSNATVTTFHSSVTMTTTVHSGSIQSVPTFAHASASVRHKTPLKPIIAQKPTSFSQPVKVVKIHTGKPASYGTNGPMNNDGLGGKITSAQNTDIKPSLENIKVVRQPAGTAVRHLPMHREDYLQNIASQAPNLLAAVQNQYVVSNGGSSYIKTKEEVEEVMLERNNPLNMRVLTLSNFPSSQQTYRVNYRSHAMAVHRAKAGSITNAAKSLDLLRQNLQKFINKEIDEVVQKYVETYFKPAMLNIKENNGEDSPALDEYLNSICAQVLEEAKKVYMTDVRSITPDITDNQSEAGSVGSRPSSRTAVLPENKDIRAVKHSLFKIKKRRGSSDSDVSVKRKVKKPKHSHGVSGRVTPSKRLNAELVRKEGPKWDPERLTADVQFVMGSRANKALGLGNMRGRLYVKHPELFKYIGDQEDKQWLNEHKHMPSSGGKAYLLIVKDILDLAETPEYKGTNLLLHEIVGFCVPRWMIDKMQRQMSLQRTLKNKPALAPVNHSESSPMNSHLQNSDDDDSRDVDRVPFSSMYTSTDSPLKTDSDIPQASPATTDNLSFDGDEEESPLQMTGGFGGGNNSRGSSPLLKHADVDVSNSNRLGLPAVT